MFVDCSEPLVSYKCKSCDFFTYSRIRKSLHHCGFRRLNVLTFNQCKKCETTTFSKVWYVRHQITCTYAENTNEKKSNIIVQKKFKCGECSFKGISFDELELHFKIIHLPLKKVFDCDECIYKAVSLDELKFHVETAHQILEDPIDCDQCRYQTISKARLKVHIQNIHQKFQCDKCELRSKSSSHQAKRHNTDESPDFNIKCGNCSFKTNDVKYLKSHRLAMHTSGKLRKGHRCTSCGSKLKTPSTPKTNGNRPKLYKCQLCLTEFCYLKGFKSHQKKIHSREKVIPPWYICSDCKFQSTDEDNLEVHRETTHLNSELFTVNCVAAEGTMPFKCVYCSYENADMATTQLHTINSHSAQLTTQLLLS